MSDSFTQEEMDALLSGIDKGNFNEELGQETAVDALQQDNQIRNYDFSSRDKIICARMPVLDMVNERFSSLFRNSLSGFLGNSVEVESSGIQVQQFSEYSQGLQCQTNLTIARFSPLRGRALIAMDPRMVFSIVDNYFGGAGQLKNPVDYKQPSPIEMLVIRLVLDLIFKDLKDAWKPVMELDFDYLGSEVNPKFANIASPSEIVVISTIHIQLDGGGGNLNITMPYSMIEPVKDFLDINSDDSTEDDREWRMAFRQQILRAEVSVARLLAEKKMAIRDVMLLKKGDVIPIDKPETVVLSVQGIPVFEGKSGVSGGHYDLQIIDKIGSGMELNGLKPVKLETELSKEHNQLTDEEAGDDLKGVEFEEIAGPSITKQPSNAASDEINLDVILDVPVTLLIEMGRTQVNIKHLLQLKQGSVVELDRFFSRAPLDVLVNGTLIAHGEVVVANEEFGIRLTDIVSPSERIER